MHLLVSTLEVGPLALAVEVVGIDFTSSGFDETWGDVGQPENRITVNAGGDHSGPRGDEAGSKTAVEAGPLGKGKLVTLLGAEDDEGVVRQLVLRDELAQATEQLVEMGHLNEIAVQVVAILGRVDRVPRNRQGGGIVGVRITVGVKGRVTVVRRDDEAERFVGFLSFGHVFPGTFQRDGIGVFSLGNVAKLFKRIGFLRANVPLAEQSHTITQRLQVMRETPGVIG